MAERRLNWTAGAQRLRAPTASGAIPVIVAEPAAPVQGTVLLVHGRNGAPGQPQIDEIANSYLLRGWRVVAPELPNSAALPESGPASKLTLAGHTRSAGEVWDWVVKQWPGDKRGLAGHSIGAYAIAHLAAESDPHHVLAVSPPKSGLVLLSARRAMGPLAVAEVEREAPLFLAEMETADATDAIGRITAPLAVVTGAEDGLVRLNDARAYFSAAPNGRFFAALPGEHHCPVGEACGSMLSAALAALQV
ncbi:hypothetical protein H4P12_09150 [Paracoccus sp. 11-3]|uniref:AB hydrolase-1 domain-containing protein n=1 Tax=Paracoccus amoyensis TaxID=2760093 RepID=A0A926JCX5_9RHOB|nr:alpha/beta fold hydrolase [Paracoccus amoyensis]MBC9246879.1 hypothetical protein [Paracoccus amoyensis]